MSRHQGNHANLAHVSDWLLWFYTQRVELNTGLAQVNDESIKEGRGRVLICIYANNTACIFYFIYLSHFFNGLDCCSVCVCALSPGSVSSRHGRNNSQFQSINVFNFSKIHLQSKVRSKVGIKQ